MAIEKKERPEGIEEYREGLKQVLDTYIEGRLPRELWVPVETLLARLDEDASVLPLAERKSLGLEVMQALVRLQGQARQNLPMAAASASTAELLLEGEVVGMAFGIVLDQDCTGELVQVEVRDMEIEPAVRSQVTIQTFGPLARVVTIDGGYYAHSQFTDSINRIERLLEKSMLGRKIQLECEILYCRGAAPARSRTIEGGSLAGAVLLAVVSKLYNRSHSRNVAASFTVGSDGRIGGVDSVKEKARIAKSRGITRLLLSVDDEEKLAELPPEERPETIVFLRHVEELWRFEAVGPKEYAPQAVLEGNERNLEHRQRLRNHLGEAVRRPCVTVVSGRNEGDTFIFGC